VSEKGSERSSQQRHLSARDLERFQESVLPHLDAAHNLARYLLRDRNEAEDAVQDAFLRAIRHFDGFRGTDGRPWLLSIVRNTCFTRLRNRKTSGESVEFDETIHTVDEAHLSPEVQMTKQAAARSLREGLERLPIEFREVVVLRELEGLSYKEIAHVSGVPMGTVMSRLARARKLLLTTLRPLEAKESD